MTGFPVLRDWIEKTKIDASEKRYSDSAFGRRRRFFLMRGDSGTIRSMHRQAVNTPVQSVATDINLMAFNRISQILDPAEAVLISIVHDSVLLEVRKDVSVRISAQIRGIMEEPPEIWHGLPLVADLKIGQ